MSYASRAAVPEALLVLPHLRVQNANAISSPLTHGFPSITAFTGLMWALQRQISACGIPLKLERVGVICHHHEEQVADGYVKTFCLTRNPVDKNGGTAAIVEEGRIHLDITVAFHASERLTQGGGMLLTRNNTAQLADWATRIGEIASSMRIAGGTLLPVKPMPGRRVRPWLEVLPETHEEQAEAFARWRRQWLPGYVLVGRDDLLRDRHQLLRERAPDATLLDAWLHAARFNYEPVNDETPGNGKAQESEEAKGPTGKVRWVDPHRAKGAGWTVPIPVGYAALTSVLPAGTVANARDSSTPCAFVESIYSFGQWISPHRLGHLDDLMWHSEVDVDKGVYRCRSGYQPVRSETPADDMLPSFE